MKSFSFNLKKVKDFCIAIGKTWELTHLQHLSPSVQEKLREDVYTSFSMVLWLIGHRIWKSSDRKETIDFLKRQAPDLWFMNGLKQKLISFMYRYLPHTFIHIRYLYAIIAEKHIRPFINYRLRRPVSIK